MYKRILVPVDGSATASCGIDEAIRMAKVTGGTLFFFHAIDDQSISMALQSSVAFVDNWRQSLREDGYRILQDAKATAIAAGIPCEIALSEDLSHPVAKRVVDEARLTGAELIIMGTHGRRGIKRLLMGNSAESMPRDSPVPVLIIHQGEQAKSVKAPATAGSFSSLPQPDAVMKEAYTYHRHSIDLELRQLSLEHFQWTYFIDKKYCMQGQLSDLDLVAVRDEALNLAHQSIELLDNKSLSLASALKETRSTHRQ